MDPALHLAGPSQKTPQFAALAPDELPKLHESNLFHLDAGVGLDPPEKIRTTPRGQTVPFCGIPEKPELLAHGIIINMTSEERIRHKLESGWRETSATDFAC